MKKIIVAFFLSLACLSMRAEPGRYSPFGEGDTISILKDGETVFSYTYGTDKEKDREMDGIYADLNAVRYRIYQYSWHELLKKIDCMFVYGSENYNKQWRGEFVPYMVEDGGFRVELKEDGFEENGVGTTYITSLKTGYTLKTSVEFRTLCMFS